MTIRQAILKSGSTLGTAHQPECFNKTFVQVAGEIMVPATAMFETCLAGGCVLVGGPSVSLTQFTIMSPTQWTCTASFCLESVIDLAVGSATVHSVSERLPAFRSGVCQGYFDFVQDRNLGFINTAKNLASLVIPRASHAVHFAPIVFSFICIRNSAMKTGYCIQPATADAALHLSGAFEATQPYLQIPVSMSALMLHSNTEKEQASRVYSTALPTSTKRSQTLVNCALHSNTKCPVFQLDGILLKATSGSFRSPQPQPKRTAILPLMYGVEWEASWPANRSTAQETAPSCTSRRDPRNILATNCTRNTWHSIPSKCTHRANLAAPLSATLSWLRHATVASVSPDGRSHVASCGIGLNNLEVVATPLNLIGAAVAGMVRVASSEAAAQMQWSVMEMDHVASDNLVTLIDQDPAGTRFWHALALRPLLKPLVRPPTSSQPTDQSVCYNGAVALTGGLGGELTTADYRVRVCAHTLTDSVCPSATWFPFFAGIGSLLGVWLARVTAAVPVLLGRSGRFSSPAPADLLNAARPLVTLRCDASAGEETAAALGSNAAEFGGLAAVLHAGGVLQDAVLPQQTARSIKAVVAPKLCFMMHAMRAAQFHAVQAVNLFSSVAAFIGSPGQANYAAANSALDCWSLAMQQCGIPGKCSEMYRHFCIGRAFSVCSD